MIIRWMLCVIISLTPLAYVNTTICRVMNAIDGCQYTVYCEIRAGSTTNPTCNYQPYVTLQIVNSEETALTKAFFKDTNFDSKVRVIVAKNNSWPIISTHTFSYYSRVISINLSASQIREIQDEAFKSLYALTSLDLSFNSIEMLRSHSLVTTDNNNLEVLNISHNSLRFIARDTFYQCSKLRELLLGNNNIVNLEDNIFSNLVNLTRLDLQNNNLKALNMTLISLKNLKDLNLSNNRIAILSGFETNRLTSLERVNMSNNMINTIESNCFNQAFNLESLDLQNNNVTSTITNIMFINNGKLNYLNFYNNNITKIQNNAFQHNSLIYLNLDKNFLSGEITELTFNGLHEIKNLTLCNQNITVISANAFSGMTSLLYLNLSTNNIDVIDKLGFKNASSLVVLDLSHNSIKDVNFLMDTLANLTDIYLSNNKIERIPQKAFINQIRLRKIDISNNKITTIEQYSLSLSNLQFLNVSGNPISGSVKSNVVSPSQYLRYLDLSNLNIIKIEDMALIDLPLLARLNLSYNAIEYIGQKNFVNLNNMLSLDLSNNRLTNLHLNDAFLTNLNALYLNNNNLSNITAAIPNSNKLIYLDISHNNISEISDISFETLTELRVLRISHNKIKNFNNPQLNLLTKLQDLDLSSNRISVIDLKFYKNLFWLDISNNILNNINSSLLQNLENLQVLNMCNNNISVIPPGVFQNVDKLKFLNISSNNLRSLRYGSLKGLHNVEVVDLSKNHIAEIDVDIFHECKMVTRLIIDYNDIKYLDIKQLTNVMPKLISLSIGGNPLNCKQVVRSIKITKNTSLEITSIHKIFHEDNVYGIRCGNADFLTTTIVTTLVTPSNTSKPLAETSYSLALIIWCSILTILFVLLTIAFLFWKHYSGTLPQTRMLFTNSVELRGSDYQSDLLN